MSQDDKIATALRVIAGLERELAETRGDLARDHAERLAERADNVQQRKALVEELQKREAKCGNCGETIIWKLGPLADEITRLRASAQRLNRRAQTAESQVAKLERQIKTQPVMKLRDNTALVQELADLRAKLEQAGVALNKVSEWWGENWDCSASPGHDGYPEELIDAAIRATKKDA